MMDTPSAMTYASVISQESMRVAFLIPDLNELGVLYADVHHLYLNVPPREKTRFKSGP